MPVIAAVNGPALVHSEYILTCDIVLASETAVFQDMPHLNFRLVPGDGVHVLWPHVLGPVRGRYFLMTQQKIAAEEALRLGVVNEVLPHDALMAARPGAGPAARPAAHPDAPLCKGGVDPAAEDAARPGTGLRPGPPGSERGGPRQSRPESAAAGPPVSPRPAGLSAGRIAGQTRLDTPGHPITVGCP